MKTWGSAAARKRWQEIYQEHKPQPVRRPGRWPKVNPVALVAWRIYKKASIAATAAYFEVDPTTVKSACREWGEIVERERKRHWWAQEMARVTREDEEAERLIAAQNDLVVRIRDWAEVEGGEKTTD
jgi:hypothetical protein